jgi:hypothetical protein
VKKVDAAPNMWGQPSNRNVPVRLVPSGACALTPFVGTSLPRIPQRSLRKHAHEGPKPEAHIEITLPHDISEPGIEPLLEMHRLVRVDANTGQLKGDS